MTSRARILFVDDEKRVLNAMRGLFRRDYEVFLSTEGAEALRIATENDIDVIVADQRMPGMTGVEVLAAMKVRSPRTVRILLTGYADPTAVEGSINDGEVFRFLSKPCPPKVLRETLSLAIEAARTTPEAVTPAPRPATPDVPPQPAVATPQPPPTAPSPTEHERPVTATPPPSQPAAPPTPAATVPDRPSPFVAANDSGDRPEMHGAPTTPTVPTSTDESSSHWQSVTNVIMSEDTVEETSEHMALTSETLGLGDVSAVVFTVDSDFAATAIRACSDDRNVILATRLIKVAEAIEQENAGVLVTDFTNNGAILQKIIAALKKYMPELVTIVVNNGRDTTDMINLINFGQVFRYVLKPIEPEQLRDDVNAAVIRHLYLLNNPESAKRHEVNASVDTAESSNTVNDFLGRVRGQPPK
jgi:DNA-binding NtrC family response regulator